MESQSGIPQDLENVDFDKELVTFSPLPDPPATPTATVPKMLFIYPRLLGRIQVPGVAPITKNTKDTQDPQHAGDPSYLGVGGFHRACSSQGGPLLTYTLRTEADYFPKWLQHVLKPT